MKVLLAEHLGFCFGVEDAINLARETTAGGRAVYALGPVIHNQQVVERLAAVGLKTVASPSELRDGPVLIRAHGVDPVTLEQVRAQSSEVIDATCVLVRRAQNIVRELHEDGYRVVVIGDARHPEVKGIVGYAPHVIVIADATELDAVPQSARLGVVGQTTLSQDLFARMVGEIVARPFREVKVVNTLCKEVDRRLEAAVALCARVDVVFVLGGSHSANTREMARVCRERGVPTHHLEDWSAFRPEQVCGRLVAGVTAGASTPDWIIEEFVQELERFEPQTSCQGAAQR